MNNEKPDLSNFRQAALKHEWKEAYTIVSTLFANKVPQCTVLTANQMIRSYLRFRPYYELEWIISFAQDVIRVIQEERETLDFPGQANGAFTEAPHGVTNLVSGAVDLWESVSAAHEVNEKARHLAEATNHFIIAELSNYWETVHPNELQLRDMFWNAPTTADGKKILPNNIDREQMYRGIGFLKQPESLGYHSAKLLSLADEIEVLLNL